MSDRQMSNTGAASSNGIWMVRGFGIAMGVLIAVQAFLGGRGFFIPDADLLKMHRYIGIGTFVVAVVQIGVVFSALRSHPDKGRLLGMTGLILVLTTIQLGLGFSAKDGSAEAASWHIFNGVLLTGTIVAYGDTLGRLNSNRSTDMQKT